MFHSMFTRLLAVFLLIITVLVAVGGIYTATTLRDSVVSGRMDALLSQAREIAYLASRAQDSTLSIYLGLQSEADATLQWKARNVYDEYGAYILIVDRYGRVKDNLFTAIRDNPDFADSLQQLDIADTLRQVLSGQEITARFNQAEGGTVFTVAVPWMQRGAAMGAVFIHTSAQVVEAEYQGVVLQVILGFALAAIAAALCWWFYTRRVTKPLTSITYAAETMSQGDFTQRCDESGVAEVKQLAGAFNRMADRLDQEETNRREFVANVSHELRSPVTSIHGFVEGMLDGTVPPEEQKKYLEIVNDETARLKKLISDLLQLSRMESGAESLQMKEFDVNESIRRVLIARMNDLERKRLEPTLEFQAEPCFVHADQDRITQVVNNLVDNALKFVPENGNLTISTSLVHDRVSVKVENNGEPIRPEDREHIFERFYKADKAHTAGKGTGLGLSISLRIMQLHGQSLRLLPDSDITAFEFTLQPAGAARPDTTRENDTPEG